MPIYEYHCDACGENFEQLVFGAEMPACPGCDSDKVSRRMSACGFISKGGDGQTLGRSAGSACSGCSAASCSSCGH